MMVKEEDDDGEGGGGVRDSSPTQRDCAARWYKGGRLRVVRHHGDPHHVLDPNPRSAPGLRAGGHPQQGLRYLSVCPSYRSSCASVFLLPAVLDLMYFSPSLP